MTIAVAARHSRIGWLTADAAHGPLPALLVGLTVLTGVVDAVSILSLGRVFVANMTGNVVFVGFALAGAPGFALAASLAALAGFLVGARAGGWLIGRVGRDRARLLMVGCGMELVFVATALTITAASCSALSAGGRDVVAAVLAVGMGIQNAVARGLAVPDLTTTVLTMTLTGLAADTAARGKPNATLARRLLTVLAMLAGAVAGAELVLNASATAALALGTGLLTVVTVAAVITTRHPAPWRTPAA
ncbi:MAG: hypothetical protein QOG53_2657 [Frankiales bacterium]|jgi:uncharacterized membrane protein YoaK (UPF0700 family)|nr:hypothetical protein [Frankiales bacterium]